MAMVMAKGNCTPRSAMGLLKHFNDLLATKKTKRIIQGISEILKYWIKCQRNHDQQNHMGNNHFKLPDILNLHIDYVWKTNIQKQTQSESVNKTHTHTPKKTLLSPFSHFPPESSTIYYMFVYIDLFKIPEKKNICYLGCPFKPNKQEKHLKMTYTLFKHPIALTKTNLPLGLPRAPCSCGLWVFRWARKYTSYRPARPTDVSTDQHFQHLHYMEQQNTLINSVYSVHFTIMIQLTLPWKCIHIQQRTTVKTHTYTFYSSDIIIFNSSNG